MVNATEALMLGTKYEGRGVFYHDALTQLTCASTVNWMKEKGYYKYWILPETGLNANTKYSSRPVGDSPELMPWDCSLIKDLDDSFRRHRAWTKKLDSNDPKKFCNSTPNRLDSSYIRLIDLDHGPLEGVPTS
jgi:hypothetical protein